MRQADVTAACSGAEVVFLCAAPRHNAPTTVQEDVHVRCAPTPAVPLNDVVTPPLAPWQELAQCHVLYGAAHGVPAGGRREHRRRVLRRVRHSATGVHQHRQRRVLGLEPGKRDRGDPDPPHALVTAAIRVATVYCRVSVCLYDACAMCWCFTTMVGPCPRCCACSLTNRRVC